MNPRIPYRPHRRQGPSFFGGCAAMVGLVVLALALGGWWWQRGATPSPTPADVISTFNITPLASTPAATAAVAFTPTAAPLNPSTPASVPSSVPLASPTASTNIFYQTQSGDTLLVLAARFGVAPADIQAPNGLVSGTFLAPNQLLIIPNVLEAVGPGQKLFPDSELVFSGAAASFSPQDFAAAQGGYLGQYKGFIEARTQRGGDVLFVSARNHSLNPRLLLALLEYQSGWVTNPAPAANALQSPLGLPLKANEPLYAQLSWVEAQLAIGYYGWRAGTLTTLTFPDGSTLRLDPTLNAGTVAVQYLFSRLYDRPAWDEALNGVLYTYQLFFGDPYARALDPLLPVNLNQPPLDLPFQRGHTWYYSGGPHGAWENGGAQAAVDFAPGALEGGCAESNEWVTAVAAGEVLRSNNGALLLDLDGDGRETTGWVILYLHLADQDRVPAGAFVERGAKLGHPSCEGGVATGTHVHIARKYNGEWIPADSSVPFVLSGWVVKPGTAEYLGSLERAGAVVEACTCTAAWTAVTGE